MSFDEMTGAAGSQRWKNQSSRFILPENLFNPSRAEVVLVPESTAKPFVVENHYSGSYTAARCRVGLMVKPSRFRSDYLGGVAVFSVPMQPAAISKYLGVPAAEGVELGRLVLLDDEACGFNAESFMISRALRLLKTSLPEVKGVVSYADPVPRYTPAGEMVKPGHAGTCYRASNATYQGRSKGRILMVSKAGKIANERMLSKIKKEESGIDYACRQMVELGAPERMAHETGQAYLERALCEGGFRKMKHPGNHVFVWQWK